MDSTAYIKLAAFIGLLGTSGFFSGSESALFSLGLYRVRRLRAVTQKSYLAAQALLREPTKLISTLLTGNELVNAGISVLGSSLIYDFAHGWVPEQYLPILAVGAILPFVLIFGEVIPKTLGMKNPEGFAGKTAYPLLIFSRVVAPLRDFLAWISVWALKLTGGSTRHREDVSEVVFRTMVDTGRAEGVLDAQEQELIHNVFDLDDVRVSEIMTPGQDVSALLSQMTVGEAMEIVERDRYSRFPVLASEEGEVSGMLYVKDLLAHTPSDPSIKVEKVMRRPLVVSAEANALELFTLFRNQRTHFGVVCASHSSRMLGVVTLEDVLEEIFGEIRDEVDVEEGAP